VTGTNRVVRAAGGNLGEGVVLTVFVGVLEVVDLEFAGGRGVFVWVTGNISGVVSNENKFALVVVVFSKAFLWHKSVNSKIKYQTLYE
jgi:hypothetical protein